MEALLGLGGGDPENSCNSVDDLKDKLRNSFVGFTETSARHITKTFEFPSSVVFNVPVNETENHVLENAANLDPSLGGARSSVAPSLPNSNQTFRRVTAINTLMHQAHDDNVLQKQVSKHIVAALSEVDESNWIIRSVAGPRAEQGWTFTYQCKDSTSAWARQSAKAPAKTPIGACSHIDGQDPINLSRPSFDCRGQVTVTFTKSSRRIEVQYEHTPLHTTVKQLMGFLTPDLPPPPTFPKQKIPKAPKAPRPPKAPKEPRPPKAPKQSRKRQADGDASANLEVDGSKQPAKRRKKKSAGASQAGPDGVVPPEMPGALPVGGSSNHRLYNDSISGASAGGSDNYPEGLVNNGDQPAGNTQGSGFLNLAPEEAVRRHDVAVKLLEHHGVPWKSLSDEQFNIFANQSPDLQRDSLAMLVRYGAERLRIVHPERTANAEQPSPTQNGAGTAQSQAQPASAPKPTRSRRKTTDAVPAETVAETNVDSGNSGAASGATLKGKRTRGACDQCRAAKQKCDKAKPSCSGCLVAKKNCVYGVAKPRVSRGVDQAESQDVEAEEATAGVEPQNDPQEEPDDLGSPGFHSHEPAEMPAADMVSQPLEPDNGYSHTGGLFQEQEHSTAMNYPQTPSAVLPDPQPHMSVSAVDYLTATAAAAEAGLHSYSYPAPTSEPTLTYPEQVETTVQQTHQAPLSHQRSTSRRALPASQPTQDHSASAWQAVNHSPTVASAAPTRVSPRQHRLQRSIQSTSGAYDDTRTQSNWASTTQSTASTSKTLIQNAPANCQANQGGPGYAGAVANSTPAASSLAYDYNQYSNPRTETTNNTTTTVAYEPYNNHFSSANTSNSSSYNYNTRSSNNASSTAISKPGQTAASSYSATTATAPSTSQWGTPASSQPRNNQSYSANQSATSNSSYNMPASMAQSVSLQEFNVRPQPTQPRSSTTAAYGHQTQQPRQPAVQQQQSKQGYNAYSNKQQQSTGNSQQQQQRQNWPSGFNAVNNQSAGYNQNTPAPNTSYSEAASHTHGSANGGAYGQAHHRSMNLSGQSYSSMDTTSMWNNSSH